MSGRIIIKTPTSMIEIDDTLLIEFLGGKLDASTPAPGGRREEAPDENRRRLERLYLVFFTGERLSAAAAVDPNLSWQTLRRRIEAHRRPAPPPGTPPTESQTRADETTSRPSRLPARTKNSI